MKKGFIILLALLMLLPGSCPIQAAQALAKGYTEYLLGDADGDRDITIVDATVIQMVDVEIPVYSYVPVAADADEDDELSVRDATVVQRYLIGLTTNEHVGKRFYTIEDIQKYTDDLLQVIQAYYDECSAVISANKLDSSACTSGVILNDAGEITPDNSFCASDYIPCRKGQKIVVSRDKGQTGHGIIRAIEYFDIHKNRLAWASSVKVSDLGFTNIHVNTDRQDALAVNAVDGCYYVKVYFPKSNLDAYMVRILDPHAEIGGSASEQEIFVPFEKEEGAIGSNTYWYGKTLAFDGDSITAGYANAGRSYANYTAEALGCSLSNTAIGGSALAVNPSPPSGQDRDPLIERLDSLDCGADALIINIGSNDWHYSWTPMGDMSSSDKYTFYGALKLLCADLLERFSGKPVVLCTPIKRVQGNGLAYYEKNKYGKTLKDYSDAIKEVAEFYGIPVLDLYVECQINPLIESHKAAYFANADGVHPNAEGHTIIARRLKGFLIQLASSVRE